MKKELKFASRFNSNFSSDLRSKLNLDSNQIQNQALALQLNVIDRGKIPQKFKKRHIL